ncbi:MAG: hypothetical protein AAFN70_04610, partial [Planctomycetota bacterium]
NAMIALFRRLNEDQNITVILVTHDQNVARNAKRTWVMRDGEIVEDTTEFARAKAALENEPASEAAAENDSEYADETETVAVQAVSKA